MARNEERDGALDVGSRPKALALHLALMQYPTLADAMRRRMRQEMFRRGVIRGVEFEQEVRERAIASQRREGLLDPLSEESEEMWQRRMHAVRAILTEFYFGLNLPHADFQDIVAEVLGTTRPELEQRLPTFNPELAPWAMLFQQARVLGDLPEDRQRQATHQLRQIVVVLTKGMLSDQLSFVGLARDRFSIDDLEWIHRRRIGRGKIGGKAAGMLLAQSILYNPEPSDPVDFREIVSIPDSFFLGSDPYYEFLASNDLSDLVNYKYRPIEELRADHETIVERIMAGQLPTEHVRRLAEIIRREGRSPLIVRSSSLLEDNFGTAFAGKYDSFYCPNQGTARRRLEELCTAVKRVYASILSPDAIAYRQQKELIDYDERMGILIQKVAGKAHGNYFFPTVAGVGFSHNPLRWNPRIDRSQGFLRIVVGLGTRAVDRLDNDYARMVALSHPTLQPTKSSLERIHYAQKYMDVINIERSRIETVPVPDVLDHGFVDLKPVASLVEDGELRPVLVAGAGLSEGKIVVTFDGLLRNRLFTDTMKALLKKVERNYRRPVDIEFTVQFDPRSPVGFRVVLLQCRQQSRRADQYVEIPPNIAREDIVLRSGRMVANGRVEAIRYVVYVDPERYRTIADPAQRVALARGIGELNQRLADEVFVLVGPGRWGSTNLELGVPVSYGDIFHARLLVEVALPHGDVPPEASFGTHFFQDLVESDILPLPIYPAERDGYVRYDFFRGADNVLAQVAPELSSLSANLKLIDVPRAARGRLLEVVMDDREDRAVGYLTEPPQVPTA